IAQASDSSLVPSSWGAPMNVRYRVELYQDERDELTALLSGGIHAASKLKRAQILRGSVSGTREFTTLRQLADRGSPYVARRGQGASKEIVDGGGQRESAASPSPPARLCCRASTGRPR